MNLVFLSLFLPLFASLVSGSFAFGKNRKILHYANSVILAIAAICSLKLFHEVIYLKSVYNIVLFPWISIGDFVVNWSFKFDSLTAVMFVVVLVVSSVVHFYSVDYMAKDPRVNRFMSYISLFTFFMLILVSSGNFVQLFIGWEGVGLCSYLLIGFWYKKKSANLAAFKAFIVNRVGDVAYIIAMIAIYTLFGSLEFDVVFADVPNFVLNSFNLFGSTIKYIDFICILLFIGCMGKSAQIFLHTWLPDAMEGPTPVSALIHAATMVTAGVFLVARCSPIFEFSQIALVLIMLVGAVTAFIAATIAVVQTDIKKIIAYSTCSQLGYMFFACGASAYSAGIFHLMTHAFFKALLFLTAGNVLIALHHEQNIMKMGKLYKKMPITYFMVWIGTLAICGIPPFSGFFSKDLILEMVFLSDGIFARSAYIIGVLVVFLTALYSSRLLFLVFHGNPSLTKTSDKIILSDIKDVPKRMNFALSFLLIGAIFAGYYGYEYLHIVSGDNLFWGDAIFVKPDNNPLLDGHPHLSPLIKYMPLASAILGIFFGYLFYISSHNIPLKIAKSMRRTYQLLVNKWFFDVIYDFLIVRPYRKLSVILWRGFDKFIDEIGPNGFALVTKLSAKLVSKSQTGFVFHYAFTIIIATVALVSFCFWILVRNYI
jgi:NADH-quinone oxidoreductase subunit L